MWRKDAAPVTDNGTAMTLPILQGRAGQMRYRQGQTRTLEMKGKCFSSSPCVSVGPKSAMSVRRKKEMISTC
jgi:hypothetical protein